MRYRDHRGSLAASLATTQQMASARDLLAHLVALWEPEGRQVEAITYKYVGFDARTGWDTWYVLVRLRGDAAPFVAGMADEMPAGPTEAALANLATAGRQLGVSFADAMGNLAGRLQCPAR